MDLTIAAISVSQQPTANVEASGQRYRPFHAAMDAAAGALGMQPQDLFAALRSGQSLSDVAASKGVSMDQLVSTMAGAIAQSNPNISSDQATQIAQRLAAQVPGEAGPAGATGGPSGPAGIAGTAGVHPGRRHHHHRGGGGDPLSAAAGALGENPSQVLAALQGGQSLASIGSANGVSQDQLVSAVVTALQRDNPNLTTDQATQFATEFVTATGQSGSQVNVSA